MIPGRSQASNEKIGLCITATGKYNDYIPQLIQSAREWFFKGHTVTYFVFTDGILDLGEDVKRIDQKKLGWPYDSMMRCDMYLNSRELFKDCDYLFSLDADMVFVADVGEEILGDLVGTRHPLYYQEHRVYRLPYEVRKNSTACVIKKLAKCYFAGAFYGGKKKSFLQLLSTISDRVKTDLNHDIMAIWHDESHLNRYFMEYPPDVILSPSYCYPEGWTIPFQKRIQTIDKNAIEMRK